MKTQKLFFKLMFLGVVYMGLSGCSKDGPSSKGLASLAGNWENPEWGGAGNTIIITFSTSAATGTIVSIGPQTSGFSANEVIYKNITATGTQGIYNCMGEFRVGTPSVAYWTTAVLQLQGNSLTATYQPADGYQPPVYGFTKE